MDIMDIVVNNKKYKMHKTININGKCYVSYYDKDSLYISEYVINQDNSIEFLPISDEIFKIVKGEMNL